jgi:anti-sigma-K factor RskA
MNPTPTAACNECRNLLGGYVLRALEPDEVEGVRRHLATCASCAAELEQLAGIPAILDTAGVGAVESTVESPPPALEEAVLDKFAREHPHEHSARAGAAAAAGADAATPEPPKTAVERGTPSELASRRAGPTRARRFRSAFQTRLARPLPSALAGALAAAAITAALIVLPGGNTASAEQYQASLFGSPAAPGARASAKLRVFASGTHVKLSVRGLRGSPDTVYELWCLRDDGAKVSAGTFRTDASGRADVSLTTAAVPGEYHRLGVERRSLSPGGPPSTSVMAGEIQYPHS